MAINSMPFIRVSGTHREVGRQIGEALRPKLRQAMAWVRSSLPPGVTWADMLLKGRLCLSHSRSAYPRYVEELEGMAEGASVAFEELFLSLCEELWEPAAWLGVSPLLTGQVLHDTASPLLRGCTDLAARGAATVGGATLIAHNNDTAPEAEEYLITLQVQAGDEPEFVGVTIGGLGFSAGFNAAGISMTGNAVSCQDIRPGVPRMLLARAILGARRLGEALDACLLPLRASNYNNVIADANGEIYSMEGSATDCEPIYVEDNILSHSNHYVSLPMRRYEATPHHIGNSIFRYYRTRRLLQENYGRLSPQVLQKLLADHANYPGSVCKHDAMTTTTFSIITNLDERRAWIGRGRPCEATYQEHILEPWAPPPGWPQ